MKDENIVYNFIGEQDYHDIEANHDEFNLFKDDYFPAQNSSLGTTQYITNSITWRRPKDVVHDPKFCVSGFHRSDLNQGGIGNCWFIAALGTIMRNRNLFDKICPRNQSFNKNYCGMFHFCFWHYGKWVNVVIDDRLPFGSNNRLYFCKNNEEPNEFWSALLEKAYAKLYKSYQNLNGGFTEDALIDLTGGIQEKIMHYSFKTKEDELWNQLVAAWKKESLLTASIHATTLTIENILKNGLIEGHAYSITKFATINNSAFQDERLLRIRNPWGNSFEWNGAWSDDSSEWKKVSYSTKHKLGLKKEYDGEFWINLRDFIKNFSCSEIVHLSVNSYNQEVYDNKIVLDHEWNCTTHHSEWKIGDTAGGSTANAASYWTNPQFLVELSDNDFYSDGMTQILISLMQKDAKVKNIHNEIILFDLYRVRRNVDIDNPGEMRELKRRLYASQLRKIGSALPRSGREITKRFTVSPGFYVVIPHTYYANCEHEFMLRLFTEQPINTDIHSLDEFKEDLDERDLFFQAGTDDDLTNFIKLLSTE